MRNTSSFIILASALILAGGIFLLENYGIISGVLEFWPVLTTIVGIGFVMLFLKNRKKDKILLGMGSLVLLNSIFFFYLNFTGWGQLALLWPVFMILLGLTFIIVFLFSEKRVLIYLATILIALGVSFILIFAVSTRLWPITLMLAGVSFAIINLVERFSDRR